MKKRGAMLYLPGYEINSIRFVRIKAIPFKARLDLEKTRRLLLWLTHGTRFKAVQGYSHTATEHLGLNRRAQTLIAGEGRPTKGRQSCPLATLCELETSALHMHVYLGKQGQVEQVREGTEPGLGSYALNKLKRGFYAV